MTQGKSAVAVLFVAGTPEDLAALRSISSEAGWELHEAATSSLSDCGFVPGRCAPVGRGAQPGRIRRAADAASGR